MELHEILTALAALVGAVAGVYSLRLQKNKTLAEAETEEATAADIIQGASKELIEQYKIRINELIDENKQLKEQVIETRALKEQIILLNAEICALKAEIETLKLEIEKFKGRR